MTIGDSVEQMDAVAGREAELGAIKGFIERLHDGPRALLLRGEAGIGKTTLWRAGVAFARQKGYQVLSASPAESESHLPYAALTDVLEEVPGELTALLPEPQRDSLEMALLRRRREGHPAEQHAVSVAVLSLFRRLAEARTVLLGLDDIQWIDQPSARVLAFAIRRLEHERVGILGAEREVIGKALPLGLDAVASNRIEEVTVEPLSGPALIDLLQLWLPAAFSPPTLRRISEISGGNPFFAIEIGRLLLRPGYAQPDQPLPIPDNLKQLVRSRLSLPRSSRYLLLAIAILAQPERRTLTRLLGEETFNAGLERALSAGLLVIREGRIHFTHPLIGSVVHSEGTEGDRRQLHRRLADVLEDPGERAHHLALGAEEPNESVAVALENAAAAACAHGAPDAAASFMEQAVRMSTAAQKRQRRALEAAEFHMTAGDYGRARSLLEQIEVESPTDVRRPLLHRLGQIEFFEGKLERAEDFYNQALAAPGNDPRLELKVLGDLQLVCHQQGKFAEASAHAGVRVALAAAAGHRQEADDAAFGLAVSEFIRGEGITESLHRRAVTLSEDVSRADVARSTVLPQAMDNAVLLKWSDDFDHARKLLKGILEQASDEYDESFVAPLLFHLGEIEYWAGNLQAADKYAAACAKATHYSGRAGLRMLPLSLTAMLAAHRGDMEPALAAAEEALSLSLERGNALYRDRSLRTLGFIELSLGRHERADFHLARLRSLDSERGGTDPGILRYEGDRIEALIGLGQPNEAEHWTEYLEERGRRLDRPWALAVGARSRALLKGTQADLAAAESAITCALKHHERLQQPFELARTLLVAGTIRRRSKQKALASQAIESAMNIFQELGARLWLARAKAELARIGGRIGAGQPLTPTEMKVAQLVASGRTNREVSRDLFMSVKTVEAHLSRIYQKLEVRSRSELAVRMVRRETPGTNR